MAQPLDPNDLVTLDELAISNMWEVGALIELLHEKGLVTKQELLDKITELRCKAPLSCCLSPKSLLGPCLGHYDLDTGTKER